MDTSFFGGIFVGLLVGGVVYAAKNVEKILDFYVDAKHALSKTPPPPKPEIFEFKPEKSHHGNYFWYEYKGKNFITLSDNPIKFDMSCVEDVNIEEVLYFDRDGERVILDDSDDVLVKGIVQTLAGPGQNFSIVPAPSLEEIKQNIPIVSGLLENIHRIIVNTDDLDEHTLV